MVSLNVGNGGFEYWMAHVWIVGKDSTRKTGNGLEVIEGLKDNLNAMVKVIRSLYHFT